MMRMIVAIDRHRGMATSEGIPWDLPTDRAFFFDQIADGPILMGHTTYSEIASPLHGRPNYVATRRAGALREGFIPVADTTAFLAAHHTERINNIGGAELFGSLLTHADELVITRIDAEFDCIRFFPNFTHAFDRVTQSDPVHENGLSFTFETWTPTRAR